MRLPDDPNKYSNRWKYIETAAWRQDPKDGQWKVLRNMAGKNTPKITEWKDIDDLRNKYNNTGIYTSVFNYDTRDVNTSTRLGSLYFDLDSPDIDSSRREAAVLAEYFLGFVPEHAIRIYFTGQKGFHIELEALALGITGSNELPAIFRSVAADLRERFSLECLDFQVYDLRRMWRLPNSIHQHTGLYKRELSFDQLNLRGEEIRRVCSEPLQVQLQEQQFSSVANEWYREYTYKFEEAKKPKQYTSEQILERFNNHGTSMLRGVGDMERQFDPFVFEECHALNDLWRKAETKHHLEHEERLFLCSILTYTDEAVYYLHEILKNCTDYNFEKSQSHIDDWIRRREMDIGGRPFSCDRANAVGVGCGDCSLEPKKKWAKIGDSWIETDEESLPSPVRLAYSYKR